MGIDIFKFKRRTVSEENGGKYSYLQYVSQTFGGGDKFISENLRNANPLEIADRLEEMAGSIESMPPPDADPRELQNQIKRLKEEADAIRKGGVNVFEERIVY